MTKDILSIFADDADVERLLNRIRNISHYRRARFRANSIEILMMLHMHTDKNSNDLLKENKDV